MSFAFGPKDPEVTEEDLAYMEASRQHDALAYMEASRQHDAATGAVVTVREGMTVPAWATLTLAVCQHEAGTVVIIIEYESESDWIFTHPAEGGAFRGRPWGFELLRQARCIACDGSGREPLTLANNGRPRGSCRYCQGQGRIVVTEKSGAGRVVPAPPPPHVR